MEANMDLNAYDIRIAKITKDMFDEISGDRSAISSYIYGNEMFSLYYSETEIIKEKFDDPTDDEERVQSEYVDFDLKDELKDDELEESDFFIGYESTEKGGGLYLDSGDEVDFNKCEYINFNEGEILGCGTYFEYCQVSSVTINGEDKTIHYEYGREICQDIFIMRDGEYKKIY